MRITLLCYANEERCYKHVNGKTLAVKWVLWISNSGYHHEYFRRKWFFLHSFSPRFSNRIITRYLSYGGIPDSLTIYEVSPDSMQKENEGLVDEALRTSHPIPISSAFHQIHATYHFLPFEYEFQAKSITLRTKFCLENCSRLLISFKKKRVASMINYISIRVTLSICTVPEIVIEDNSVE